MHRLVEESLLSACLNLGKNIIQQCLQQEDLPLDGTRHVLLGACQALAEDMLKTVQLKIWEDGCVTQKEVLSYACRGLAKLIKTQCPRGRGEIVRMQRDLGHVLSESSLAVKLADVINTRELVECVCSRHEGGLRTVLLAACQWIINDIKALFLCEEVWNNFFGDVFMVGAEFYTQLRPLLSTMIFQIQIGESIEDRRSLITEDLSGTYPKARGALNTAGRGQYDGRTSNPREPILSVKEDHQKLKNHGRSPKTSSVSHSNNTGCKQYLKEMEVNSSKSGQSSHHRHNSSIIIINRQSMVSYVIDLINTECKRRCYATILKSWRLLTQRNVAYHTEERLYYLITFGRHPLSSLQLLSSGGSGGIAFEADVKLLEIGSPVWPKDTAVMKRWCPDLSYQAMEETEDLGNQCLQIWRIGSKRMDKRRPKAILGRAVESKDGSIKSYSEPHVIQPRKTIGCFKFSKNKQTINGDDDYYD